MTIVIEKSSNQHLSGKISKKKSLAEGGKKCKRYTDRERGSIKERVYIICCLLFELKRIERVIGVDAFAMQTIE